MPLFFRMRHLIPLALFLVLTAGSASAQLDPALTRAPQFDATLPQLGAPLDPGPRGVAARGVEEADLTWRWFGDPRWIEGRSFNDGETFSNGITRGRFFTGSAIGPEGDIPVEIVFSSTETSLVQTFRRDLSYESAGVGTFPGAAYDISDPDNPRRLNINIVEDANHATPNLRWDPDDSGRGNREFVYVMASDYDGTGETYAGLDIVADAPSLDILYFWWPRLRDGATLLETDPSSLQILLARIKDLEAVPANGEVTLTWDYTPPPEAETIAVYSGLTMPAADPLDLLSADATTYRAEGLDPDIRYYFRLESLDADGKVIDISGDVRARPLVSKNVSLVGTLNPASTYGDIWGYVDPDTGREYALLCARVDGLYVIDVTDDTPVEVGFVPGLDLDGNGSADDSKDVKTYGRYAYLVNETAPIQIIDLSDPTNPTEVGTLDTDADDGPGEGTAGDDGGSHNILIEGDYLYVVGGRSVGGLRIYDLTDPVAPAFVGDFQPKYYHDVEVRNDTVYAAAIFDEGVDIIDVSDKANPALISTFIYAANYMGAHNVCSTDDGSYVFVGDEIGTGTYTRVFDVRDPFNVEQVAELIVDLEAPVHNCYVEDDLLYIAHYTEGVYVYDVRDPERPVEVGIFDTYLGRETGFLGVWTVYPYLPSGKLIASDMQDGLYVLDFDERAVATEPTATPGRPLMLGASYPNPTTGTTTVPFTLDKATEISLVLYDVLGREVAVLAEGQREAGPHTVSFDGSLLPAGAYFYRLEASGLGTSASHPLTIVR